MNNQIGNKKFKKIHKPYVIKGFSNQEEINEYERMQARNFTTQDHMRDYSGYTNYYNPWPYRKEVLEYAKSFVKEEEKEMVDWAQYDHEIGKDGITHEKIEMKQADIVQLAENTNLKWLYDNEYRQFLIMKILDKESEEEKTKSEETNQKETIKREWFFIRISKAVGGVIGRTFSSIVNKFKNVFRFRKETKFTKSLAEDPHKILNIQAEEVYTNINSKIKETIKFEWKYVETEMFIKSYIDRANSPDAKSIKIRKDYKKQPIPYYITEDDISGYLSVQSRNVHKSNIFNIILEYFQVFGNEYVIVLKNYCTLKRIDSITPIYLSQRNKSTFEGDSIDLYLLCQLFKLDPYQFIYRQEFNSDTSDGGYYIYTIKDFKGNVPFLYAVFADGTMTTLDGDLLYDNYLKPNNIYIEQKKEMGKRIRQIIEDLIEADTRYSTGISFVDETGSVSIRQFLNKIKEKSKRTRQNNNSIQLIMHKVLDNIKNMENSSKKKIKLTDIIDGNFKNYLFPEQGVRLEKYPDNMNVTRNELSLFIMRTLLNVTDLSINLPKTPNVTNIDNVVAHVIPSLNLSALNITITDTMDFLITIQNPENKYTIILIYTHFTDTFLNVNKAIIERNYLWIVVPNAIYKNGDITEYRKQIFADGFVDSIKSEERLKIIDKINKLNFEESVFTSIFNIDSNIYDNYLSLFSKSSGISFSPQVDSIMKSIYENFLTSYQILPPDVLSLSNSLRFLKEKLGILFNYVEFEESQINVSGKITKRYQIRESYLNMRDAFEYETPYTIFVLSNSTNRRYALTLKYDFLNFNEKIGENEFKKELTDAVMKSISSGYFSTGFDKNKARKAAKDRNSDKDRIHLTYLVSNNSTIQKNLETVHGLSNSKYLKQLNVFDKKYNEISKVYNNDYGALFMNYLGVKDYSAVQSLLKEYYIQQLKKLGKAVKLLTISVPDYKLSYDDIMTVILLLDICVVEIDEVQDLNGITTGEYKIKNVYNFVNSGYGKLGVHNCIILIERDTNDSLAFWYIDYQKTPPLYNPPPFVRYMINGDMKNIFVERLELQSIFDKLAKVAAKKESIVIS